MPTKLHLIQPNGDFPKDHDLIVREDASEVARQLNNAAGPDHFVVLSEQETGNARGVRPSWVIGIDGV